VIEPDYYTLQEVADKWSISVDRLLRIAASRKITLSVRSRGWTILGYTGECTMGRRESTKGEWLHLDSYSIQQLVHEEIISTPYFQPTTAEHEYENLGSGCDILPETAKGHQNTVISVNELFVLQENLQIAEQKKQIISDDALNGYTTPYLELMKRAIIQHKMSKENQEKVEPLKDWIRGNWTDELGQISEKKVEVMASIIRLPESSLGRNRKG
jgi:hypothetical protein